MSYTRGHKHFTNIIGLYNKIANKLKLGIGNFLGDNPKRRKKIKTILTTLDGSGKNLLDEINKFEERNGPHKTQILVDVLDASQKNSFMNKGPDVHKGNEEIAKSSDKVSKE